MTAGEERYQRALKQVVAQVKQEFGPELLGILLAGSAARGTPFRRSDLELYVLHRAPWRQRRTFFVEDVEVELFINPIHQIRREFRDVEHPSTFAMFAQGQILHDPEGCLAGLVEEARRAWDRPRPALTPVAVERTRYLLTDHLLDVKDQAERDEEAAGYLILFTLQAALDAHYRIQRRWGVKPKYLLADLREQAPELAVLVESLAAGEGTLEERVSLLCQLVERILAPVGGPLVESVTEPEPVPEDA